MTPTLPLPDAPPLSNLRPHFTWGVATSAAQIEGAVQERGASIWDRFCAEPGRIADGSNIDVACDHVHRVDSDVALLQWLGVKAYRFSIAWPRVQPQGRGAWNEAGFAFYDRLVDRLLAAGIQPHLTLYHWDLPAALHDGLGGWLERDVVPLFADYAAEVARRLGDRAAGISTLNEPWCVATKGYETGEFAPGMKDRAAATRVSHHLLLAHGDAVAAMRPHTRAPLGIVLNHTPAYPAEPTEADRRAARLDDGLQIRWYMDPVFRGTYPADVIAHLGADAPRVAAGDMDRIRQPLDFLGVNFYSRNFISTAVPPLRAPGDQGFSDMGWEIYPEALAQHLVRLAREYTPPPMMITENGMAGRDVLEGGRVHDAQRVDYLRSHLAAIDQAVAMGADVRGYFYWSLLDNFEWDSGYTKRFGLFHVDYASQERVAKDSALWYRELLKRQAARRAG